MGAKTLAALKESRRRVSQRHRRRGAVLRALHRARRRRVAPSSSARPKRCGTSTVSDFPAIVTMDAHGNSLHKDIEEESGKVLATLSTPGV